MTNAPQSRTYAEISSTFTNFLKLQQPPIAICFADSVPSGINAHTGGAPAGCRFWQDAAHSAFATSSVDHSMCAIGVYTHNLRPSPAQQTDLMDTLKVFGELGYVREEDMSLIPVLSTRHEYVIYSSLAETQLAPDVVLLFVNAGQTLILSEATQQIEAQNPPAMGRPACAVVSQVMNTGRAALSLGCCGARAYLDILSENVAVFAIPGIKAEIYSQQIEALVKANDALAKFHQIRRHDIEAGLSPTIKKSLMSLEG